MSLSSGQWRQEAVGALEDILWTDGVKKKHLTIAGSVKALSLFRLAAVELVGEKKKKKKKSAILCY